MGQYISKSILTAEIEKLMGNPELIEDWRYRVKMEEKNELLKSIIDTIDTLEIKEVDLEKELDSMITPELKFHKALPSLFDVAKHFFELGLKVQKGEV